MTNTTLSSVESTRKMGLAISELASVNNANMRLFTRLIHRGYAALDAAEICFGVAIAPYLVQSLLEIHMRGGAK